MCLDDLVIPLNKEKLKKKKILLICEKEKYS